MSSAQQSGLPDLPKASFTRRSTAGRGACFWRRTSAGSAQGPQVVQSTAASKAESASWVRDGQGSVLLRPAGGQRGEARHEEVQACHDMFYCPRAKADANDI